uniref:DUF3834 domain-containing protein n=1 Tax=Dictyoglomus turgidum TaxID=513050 RepID=A0A7C3WXV6_9BACT
MKKLFKSTILFLILLLLFTINTFSQAQEINVLIPFGPSIIPFAPLMSSNDQADIKFNFVIWRNIDELAIKVKDGNFDVLISPFVTLVNLQNKGIIKARHLATFNWASFYLVTNKNKRDFTGEAIYIAQKGSTQDIIFSIYLQERNLKDKVSIYYSTPQEITTLFIAKKINYALLPEPYVSMCLSEGGTIILDIQKVYRDFNKAYLPITSIGVNEKLKKDLVMRIDRIFRDNFKKLYDNPEPFVEKASSILKIDKNIINLSLKRLSFRYQGNSAKKDLMTFLNFILEKSPQVIDNKLPNEEFFKI